MMDDDDALCSEMIHLARSENRYAGVPPEATDQRDLCSR